jgi:ABC-type bacteriocin/lantibiotic exporter with double-glycine peptidase domain
MKLVRQKTKTDCGVACFAMLADISYAQARRALFGEKHKGPGYTYKDQMRNALKAFGVVLSERLTRCPRPERLTQDALIRTNELSNGMWHWVVWDARRAKILDPLPYKRRLRPLSCLVVLERTSN